MTVTLLDRARAGDDAAFAELVAPYQRELHAHCYRMLGSVHDADDALQDALLGAWKGLDGFEGRASLRAWLYRIATNAALKVVRSRPHRMLSLDHGPARSDVHDLGEPVLEPVFVEPWAGAVPQADPAARYDARESVELAFVAALQHLPATQRAVLILREVLAFSAAEVAGLLGTSVASVNSALQRARASLGERVPPATQQATLAALGEDGRRRLVDDFVAAWERSDVPALLELLVEDARFTMPPLPAWFDGRVDVGRFLDERVFELPWRLVPLEVNGQPGFAAYQREPEGPAYRLGAVQVLTLRGDRVAEITAFLDPALGPRLGLPEVLAS